jgi:hypothetical protein
VNEGLRCLIDALAARPTSPYVRLFAVNDVGLEWSDGTCSTWRVRTGAEALENLIAANLWAPDEEVSWGCAHCDRTGRDPRERIGWRSLFCTLCKGTGAVPNPPYVSDAWAWAAVGVVRTADVLGERMGAVDAHVIEARAAALRCAYLCTEPLDAGFRHL